MSHGHDEELTAGYWEERYRSGAGGSRRAPSPSLVAEAGDLPPGEALDAGCGAGGDAAWLADRGWHVTAADVSATALDQARAQAAGSAAADRITWVQADLTTWQPDRAFDLVTSHYVHVPGPPEVLFRRLASWVAPGGSLLVVGHDAAHGHGHRHGHGHARPAGAEVQVEQVVGCLDGADWDVLVAEPRTHEVQRPDGGGPVQLQDVVVHARRRTG